MSVNMEEFGKPDRPIAIAWIIRTFAEIRFWKEENQKKLFWKQTSIKYKQQQKPIKKNTTGKQMKSTYNKLYEWVISRLRTSTYC